MEFKELSVGDWLKSSINITGAFVRDGIYRIQDIVRSDGRTYLLVKGDNGSLKRIYEKDYDNEFGSFTLYKGALSRNKPFDTPLEAKVKLPSEFTSPETRAKALRYEQEYLLDSLRTSDDLEENEKDMLRLKEIGEELEALTAFDTVLEEHVEWK